MRSFATRSISSINLGSLNSFQNPVFKIIICKPVTIQKSIVRHHAGCGMPHGGDELPGVGMDRELRAHLNIHSLKIIDTSGTTLSYADVL